MVESGVYQGGVIQKGNREELREQRVDIRNMLPIYIFTGMEYASYIEGSLPFGTRIQKRYITEFHRTFWHIYNYVKNSVEMDKLNPDLVQKTDAWFELFKNHYNNTELLLVGVKLFLALVKNMQEWGIGQLFEKGIDPPFMSEGVDDLELLLEELEEEVVADDMSQLQAKINGKRADVIDKLAPGKEEEEMEEIVDVH